MTLTPSVLRRLVASALRTDAEEMLCDACTARVDRFAELRLAGRDTAEVLPLVEEHLGACGECREEFEALMDVLRIAEREGLPE